MNTLFKKNAAILNKIKSPIIVHKNDLDTKRVEFQNVNNGLLLKIEIKNITQNNYKILLKGDYLNLIITETKVIQKPFHLHNIDWNFVSDNDYDIIKSVSIHLPGDNFYLIRHFAIPEDHILKVFLGNININ